MGMQRRFLGKLAGHICDMCYMTGVMRSDAWLRFGTGNSERVRQLRIR